MIDAELIKKGMDNYDVSLVKYFPFDTNVCQVNVCEHFFLASDDLMAKFDTTDKEWLAKEIAEIIEYWLYSDEGSEEEYEEIEKDLRKE